MGHVRIGARAATGSGERYSSGLPILSLASMCRCVRAATIGSPQWSSVSGLAIHYLQVSHCILHELSNTKIEYYFSHDSVVVELL